MAQSRYHRQIILEHIGSNGQKKLHTKKAVIIGGGGLGSNSADMLVRTGIGSVTIYDHDTVTVANLHRTSIFTEQDIDKPKATILQNYLTQVNTDVHVTGIPTRITQKNITHATADADIIIDGTDSFALRYLINDTALHQHKPWTYAGIHGTTGMVMGIIPQKTPCFRCITPNIPPDRTTTLPIISTLPRIIAAIQTTEALKILLDQQPTGFIIYNIWTHRFEHLPLKKNPQCICSTHKKEGKKP